ncbi:ComF family protein [Desulforamulus hydrothermalis]|uniref:Phosphoribosyltransferase n=1 Tax=Desulforamulus hydrothermalis Lam5 = DSM 18033 TaxID=1121428 RepID=K8DXX2_9FIRM|nr:ComF family protein [Desulforamulus hydrothermalis]CCO07597.1 Phosphoribosyltransferase [Desulforamulus hydrothermalis Lam5 = DSM 18033]SHH20246.1 comF family protein [Desulforamulus hydrothermalis Lam5 = DSM 18033]
MHPLWEALLNLLFPRRPGCPLCGRAGPADLCPACRQLLADWAAKPKCRVCGRPLALPEQQAVLCGRCRRRLPPFELARAAGPYEGGLRQAIHLLKYRGRKSLAPLLGQIMAASLPAHSPLRDAQLVLPVPMARGRLRERGFNQAELLAASTARCLNLPLANRLLVKSFDTPPQTGLNRQQRQQNLQGAFQVTAPAQIAGRRILLVDDVFTTGATAAAVAGLLKQHGAAGVYVLTAANTEQDRAGSKC